MLTADQARKKTLKIILKENKDLLLVVETKIRKAINEGESHIHINFDDYTSEGYELGKYLRSLGYCITRNPKTEVWYIGWE